MKVGDLIRVRYYDTGQTPPTMTRPFYGVVCMTPDMGKNCIWKMWCLSSGTEHVLMPHRDEIEVINES